MKDKHILFIVHRLYFNGAPKLGGIDRIIEYLKRDNHINLIEHPLNRPAILWGTEFFVNLLRARQHYDLAVASDPLNFFSCFALKIMGNVTKTQLHCTDYAKERFSNPLLNGVYQWLFSFAVKHADIVTVVSVRMKEYAESIRKNTVFFLPNSPIFSQIPKVPIAKKNKGDLVFLTGQWGAHVNESTITGLLQKALDDTLHITLHVVGYVDEIKKNELQKKFSNLTFHGSASYDKTMELMARCSIGITAYTPVSYSYYADSLKIREYAAAGLPIVCDNTYSTSEEVVQNKAGCMYSNVEEMILYVKKLMTDAAFYKKTSEHALSWAKELDKEKLLDAVYNKHS